jgi:hypothetical protein
MRSSDDAHDHRRLEEVGDVTMIASEGEPVQPITALCLGGRGKLDHLLTAIAVQLLNKHGFKASQASYERFAAGRLEARLASRPTVCVISFDAGELMPYLHNLLLRVSKMRVSREVILGTTGDNESATGHSPIAVSGRTILVVASFQQLLRTCG